MNVQTLAIQAIETNPALKPFWPEIFEQHSSNQIYRDFIGEALPANSLFIVIGTDLGCMLDYLAGKYQAGQKFIFLDHPPVIEFLQHSIVPELREDFKKQMVLMNLERFHFDFLYEFASDYVMRNASLLLKSVAVDQRTHDYYECYQHLDREFHKFSVSRADNRNFKPFYESQIFNACDFEHPIKQIENSLDAEIPAIVLGGGPSLDKVIPWLRENQSKVWIFTVGRICKRLAKEGITPDFIGTIDNQSLSFDYTREGLAFYDKSVLLTNNTPNTQIISQWRGLKAYSKRRFPWRVIAEENYISEGPTITNALLGMALYLGAKEVYLAGVDLCFSKEGKTHESQSVESNSDVDFAKGAAVFNYLHEEMATNIQLFDALNNFNEQMRDYLQTYPGIDVYNLNAEAAVIEGVVFKSIEKLAAVKAKPEVVELYRAALASNEQVTRDYLVTLSKDVSKYGQWLYQLTKEGSDALTVLETLFTDPAKDQKCIKQLVAHKKSLEKLIGDDYATFVNYGREFFVDTLKPVSSEEQMSHEEIKASFYGFFNGIKQTARSFQLRLDALKNRIAQRQEELNPNTSLADLAKIWLENEEPGRFYIWLDQFASDDYEFYQNQYPEAVAELEQAYQALIHSDERLLRNMELKKAGADWFFDQLLHAFQNQDARAIEELQDLLKSINSPEIQAALLFSKGLQMELKQELSEALDWYVSVDPKCSVPQIQQRVFPLAFHLGKNEVGLLALEKVCRHNVAFIPQYANALQIMGNLDGALEILSQYPYLQQDLLATVDLIRFYLFKNDIERVQALVDNALQNSHFDKNETLKLLADIGITFE